MTDKVQESIMTPIASITAEVGQTAKGDWTGSVKVSVTAPMHFRSYLAANEPFDQVYARVEGELNVPEGSDSPFPEASVRPYVYIDSDDKSVALILSPTDREYEIRESVTRMLYDAALTVKVLVDQYNGTDVEVTEKPKGAK